MGVVKNDEGAPAQQQPGCSICGERDYPTRQSRCEHPDCPPAPSGQMISGDCRSPGVSGQKNAAMPKEAQELSLKHDWCPSCKRGWSWVPSGQRIGEEAAAASILALYAARDYLGEDNNPRSNRVLQRIKNALDALASTPSPGDMIVKADALKVIEDLRVMAATNFIDANCAGQRGQDRTDALYDAYQAVRAICSVSSTDGNQKGDGNEPERT